MEFSRESFGDCLNEAVDLIALNQVETGVLPFDEFELDVDKYMILESQDMLRLYTARRNGMLVGYSVFFIVNHPHYKKRMFALQDVLYMHPSYRGVGAVKFIMWIDEQLEDEQAIEYVIRQVSKKKDYSKTLERLGYNEMETSYIRNFH